MVRTYMVFPPYDTHHGCNTLCLKYSRTLSNDHPLIRPLFCVTVFSVCAIPDRRPSLRRDQRPGQMGFSPSRTTTTPTVYFQESRVAVQHPFPIMYYYNVVPRNLSSKSIALNFLLLDVRSLAIASRASQFPSGALSCRDY